MSERIWTLAEVKQALPEIIQITRAAFDESNAIMMRLDEQILPENEQEALESKLTGILNDWTERITEKGAVVKHLWLVDFDNGQGYYCWQLGEETVMYEHDYDDVFAGRRPISEDD